MPDSVSGDLLSLLMRWKLEEDTTKDTKDTKAQLDEYTTTPQGGMMTRYTYRRWTILARKRHLRRQRQPHLVDEQDV